MSKLVARIALAAVFSLAAVPIRAQTPDLAKLVTPADVEKITGVKGITALDSGALNEKTVASRMFMASGTPTATVFLFKPNTFAGDKAHSVAGIGNEAFEANQGLAITFRKGAVPVMITGMAPQMNRDKVRALAKLIADRM